ncbi:MAG: DinB family protein [Phycisphaeraceae bacterium]
MANRDELIGELKATRQFFLKTLSSFEQRDSTYQPMDGVYSVAGHVHHVADTVNWFVEAAFGKGWNLDFEASIARSKQAMSLKDEKKHVDEAFARAEQAIGGANETELDEAIPDQALMPGTPRAGIVGGIVDHTAHHRGALAVYARLLGKEPPVPYF